MCLPAASGTGLPSSTALSSTLISSHSGSQASVASTLAAPVPASASAVAAAVAVSVGAAGAAVSAGGAALVSAAALADADALGSGGLGVSPIVTGTLEALADAAAASALVSWERLPMTIQATAAPPRRSAA